MKSCVIYLTKINFSVQNLPESAPKMYSHGSRFHPNRFTFGGVIAERVNAVFCLVEIPIGCSSL